MSKAYFNTAMAYFRGKYDANVIFIVASDDIGWSRNVFRKEANVVYTRTSSDGAQMKTYTDFAILANCNHSIISHGMFGFWSAYLRPRPGGITLFVNNSYQYNTYKMDSNWIEWNDPCIYKKPNGQKWQFKSPDENKDCWK